MFINAVSIRADVVVHLSLFGEEAQAILSKQTLLWTTPLREIQVVQSK